MLCEHVLHACGHCAHRFLAVLAPNPTLAAAYGGLALLILILTSGFAIVKNSIPVYWIWAYYISPVNTHSRNHPPLAYVYAGAAVLLCWCHMHVLPGEHCPTSWLSFI